MSAHTRKTVIVTGGATGIGLATVRRLLVENCNVMIGSRDAERARLIADRLGADRVAYRETDVTDESAVVSLVEATTDRFGRLDWLFNNAGVEGTAGPMGAWSVTDIDEVLAVNVKGVFLCMKHAAPAMSDDGVIVNSSSLLGTLPMPLAAPYAASKAAVLSLTRSAAAELAARGISVHAVCPGIVDTPMMDRISALAGAPKEALAEGISPGERLFSPDRVADVVTALFMRSLDVESGSAVRVSAEGIAPVTVEFTRELRPA